MSLNKPWIRSRRFWVGILLGYILCGLTALAIAAVMLPTKLVGNIVKPSWEPTPIQLALQCSEPALPTELLAPYIEGWKDGVAMPYPPFTGSRPHGFIPVPFNNEGGVFFIPPCPDLPDNQVPEPNTLALLGIAFGALWRMK